MDEEGDRAGESISERAGASTAKVWFMLEADRWLVAAALSGVLWLAIVAAGLAHPTPAHELLATGDPVETLFQALVAATVTAVTLVLTLSQLVLAQELGPAGDQHQRMDGAMDFRQEVADAVGTGVSPADPAAFLRTLVRATRVQAEAVREAAAGADLDADVADLLDTHLEAVIENAEAVTDSLEGADFGTFAVVSAALDYNYSWKLYAGRRLLVDHGDALPVQAREALAELVETLELFGPAREHVKTLYFQWELSNLSLVLLLTAIPALAVSVATLAFFKPAAVTGTILGLDHALLLLATATTLALLPFTLLLAYVLRIVTVAKRTLSIGPFILRETDRDADVDWD